MALAVEDAVAAEEHLLVQAGTGTGKSLAYLVPAVADAINTGTPAIVATATLALQAQIVDRDMPRVADALAPLLGRRPTYVLVKGRRNYLCQHKLAGGFHDDEGALFSSAGLTGSAAEGSGDAVDTGPASRLGAEVVLLRAWAETTESGDRDELVPGVSERAWRQVSVSARECLGSKCPMRQECFVERSREAAKDADVVVTNHSFMAIDAFENRSMLPEHHLLVIDEAHELVDRVTATVTDELSPGTVTTAARKAGTYTGTDDLVGAGEVFAKALAPLPEGRLLTLPDSLGAALAMLRTDARNVQSGMKSDAKGKDEDGARAVARAAVDELVDVVDRILEERELDVVWVNQHPQRGPVLRVAPMSVAMELRDKLFTERTVVLTSATIELGGTFDAVAGTLGLRGEGAPDWQGLDVGSPFDYGRQGIAYVATGLPAPGRDGPSPQMFDELEELIRAAGGRTLGLFSSMRAAQAATEEMRERFGDELTILCQGEDQITTLVREFASDATTCLFGTLTLWQGVDVPGPACQLVVIDRIPFPRPDDPLASARTQAIGRMGGNGFIAVSATHAALRLAQGAGRLVRRSSDRGVVAFLDSRMITARYAGFLQKSIPPFWPTTDKATVLQALRRLDESAEPIVPIAAPPMRGVVAGETEHPPAPGAQDDATDAGDATATTEKASEAVTTDAPTAPDSRTAVTGATATTEKASEAVTTDAPTAPDSRTAVTGGHSWTRADDEELKDGRDLGLDAGELAEHLDIPIEAVESRLKLLRL
ncbi:ATP-dependent DNA helicase [Mobilicoccus massiliensis]|uniref:ATP-dependent DNA helicase n=1 Tax=Mobilicoccus massiliensis TaxID=1522310 RepID=UPI001FE2B7C4|nr:ATP-dependent DNA helicase [Mobilicoccus massiliensis]